MTVVQRNFVLILVLLTGIVLIGPYFGLHLLSSSPNSVAPFRPDLPVIGNVRERIDETQESTYSEIEELLER